MYFVNINDQTLKDIEKIAPNYSWVIFFKTIISLRTNNIDDIKKYSEELYKHYPLNGFYAIACIEASLRLNDENSLMEVLQICSRNNIPVNLHRNINIRARKIVIKKIVNILVGFK